MALNQVPNTNIQSVEPNAPRTQGVENTHSNNESLGNVQSAKRSSKLATFGRVLLGICTLGISEGIRALVRRFSTRAPAPARINQNPTNVNLQNNAIGQSSQTEKKSCTINQTAIQLAEKRFDDAVKDPNLKDIIRFSMAFGTLKDEIYAAYNAREGEPNMEDFTRTLLEQSPSLKKKLAKQPSFLKEAANAVKHSETSHFIAFAKELLKQLPAIDNKFQEDESESIVNNQSDKVQDNRSESIVNNQSDKIQDNRSESIVSIESDKVQEDGINDVSEKKSPAIAPEITSDIVLHLGMLNPDWPLDDFSFQNVFSGIKHKYTEAARQAVMPERNEEPIRQLTKDLLASDPALKDALLSNVEYLKSFVTLKKNSINHTFAMELLRQLGAAPETKIPAIYAWQINEITRLLNENKDSLTTALDHFKHVFKSIDKDIQNLDPDFRQHFDNHSVPQFARNLLESSQDLRDKLNAKREFLNDVVNNKDVDFSLWTAAGPYNRFASELLKVLDED